MVGYENVFPPSRRTAYLDVLSNTLGQQRDSRRYHDVMDIPPRLASHQNCHTPESPQEDFSSSLEYTTEEIRMLGDFPSYDLLTGVNLPKPYVDFDPSTALPRPYRPFRWRYQQTMGSCALTFYCIQANNSIALSKLESDWWLEVENTYTERMRQRLDLFQRYGSKILNYLPGSELACKELMEMCLQFYCTRYPKHFTLSEDKYEFHNGILSTTTLIKSMHPLQVLLHNVPEDFAIMMRNNKDGLYYLRAGIICSAIGWDPGTKLGLQLNEIHAPVPDYKQKMAFSMDRFFSKMPTDAPIQRGSWGFECGEPLYIPPGHEDEKWREQQDPDLRVEDCHLRVDWQTLRRIALSGAIVFNFKAMFTPLMELRDEQYIPSLILRVLQDGNRDILEYKNTWHVEHVVIPALKVFEKEQYERKLRKGCGDGGNWDESTLDEAPFFPGWNEKWAKQQGFGGN